MLTKNASKCEIERQSETFFKELAETTRDKNVLEIVPDYKNPFQVEPIQVEARNSKIMNEKQSILANQDIESILLKGNIQKVLHVTRDFLSNIFLVDKADGGKRSVPEDPQFHI